jgi:methanogenic corrinoid protein MtbC1
MPDIEELLKAMHDEVVSFNEEGVREATAAFNAAEYDPLRGILDGLAAGMNTVGRLFKEQEYFVPEVLLCAEAMNAGVELLKPRMRAAEVKSEGTVVLGTVQGDVHDIGKNLVKMMLEVGGFTVHDLGANVPHERFVEEVLRTDADLVGISAMMTTTMMGMKTVIPMIKAGKPGVGVLVGGAPVTHQIAAMFKADGYTQSAADIVAEAKRVMAATRRAAPACCCQR